MVKDSIDPLAGKSQALKAALAAVEQMNGAPRRGAPKAKDTASKSKRSAHKAPDAPSTESHKSGEA